MKSEEILKTDIYKEFFKEFEYETLGKIDFALYEEMLGMKQYILWAESKKGNTHDIYESFVQLILTIGKEKTYSKEMPPKYIGAFDAEKIAFIEYSDILHIFSQNDFDWNVTPSDHSSKEFKQLFETAKETLQEKKYLYYYDSQDEELREFIKENFIVGKEGTNKMQVDKNNFVHVFNQWLREVKPTIQVNWDSAKKKGIVEADFFLADLMSENNMTLYDKLFVVLRDRHYELDRVIDEDGFLSTKSVEFSDGQKAHKSFWNKYERPPKEQYRTHILERRDMLVPDDMREKKGAFYTPEMWVAKSQEYLAKTLGDDWQKEYYIWDCCAGTGNLLVGLSYKYRIFASTLEKADVEVIRQNLVSRGTLLDEHIFQFDFLNDSFDDKKVPEDLRKILSDPEKRKRLVIYINPPYVEAGNKKQLSKTGENRENVSTNNNTYERYKRELGAARNELFAQFFMRIYKEIDGCILAEFSKLKFLQATNFSVMRDNFLAQFCRGFIVPANTFDNVSGHFPIGFMIWDTKGKVKPLKYILDIYSKDNVKLGKKKIIISAIQTIGQWLISFEKKGDYIGCLNSGRNDFQNQNIVHIANELSQERTHASILHINLHNLIVGCIYLAVRHCIRANWINDRDIFHSPNRKWKQDKEFQSNCLAYALFHGQNRITSKQGTNHWIPFVEEDVNARGLFDSHFMSDFIAGKVQDEESLIDEEKVEFEPIVFSEKAQAVMDAGRELWKYYHKQPNANPNASYYDIKAYFQGVNDKGKMNASSEDDEYNRLHNVLKETMKVLAKEIEAKVYEYEFLLR